MEKVNKCENKVDRLVLSLENDRQIEGIKSGYYTNA